MKIRPILFLALSLAACDDAPDKGASKPSAASASPSASVAAIASASASATVKAAPADPLVGTWRGAYDAKKGSVSLPPKVKDKALAADDGKAASGAGTVEVVVGERGELKGKSSGALGPSALVGRAEDGMIRATVNPDDPRAPGAMTGVLVGKLVGDKIVGELRVAGPDATVVRESKIELTKK